MSEAKDSPPVLLFCCQLPEHAWTRLPEQPGSMGAVGAWSEISITHQGRDLDCHAGEELRTCLTL